MQNHDANNHANGQNHRANSAREFAIGYHFATGENRGDLHSILFDLCVS